MANKAIKSKADQIVPVISSKNRMRTVPSIKAMATRTILLKTAVNFTAHWSRMVLTVIPNDSGMSCKVTNVPITDMGSRLMLPPKLDKIRLAVRGMVPTETTAMTNMRTAVNAKSPFEYAVNIGA